MYYFEEPCYRQIPVPRPGLPQDLIMRRLLLLQPASSTMLARATHTARRALATSEASGKHVPWGASGSGTYTKSTKGCFDVIARAAPLVRAATERALAARAAAGTAHCTPFGIGDFGAADGGTSLLLLADVVAAVRAAEPAAPIVVGYEDQAQNDWQSLFALVGGTLEGGPPTYARAGNVFVSAVGTSFYESCFAPASLDLAVSFTAFHWLRDVPGPIPDALHSACSGDAATAAAGVQETPGGFRLWRPISRSFWDRSGSFLDR